MKYFIIGLLFCSFSGWAQQVYLPHEVEKQAEPTGGPGMLHQFLASNVQIPFSKAVEGINGRVYVRGVVEPDGSLSKLEIAKGLDSLCNMEALRAMGLFKAWQPAQLKGAKVRQQVVFPVAFKQDAVPQFDSKTYQYTDYFDKNSTKTADVEQAVIREVRPVDTKGYTNGDVVFERKSGKKWEELKRVPFKRREMWYKPLLTESSNDSVQTYQLLVMDENGASYASEPTFQMNGRLLSYKEFGHDTKVSRHYQYDLTGLLRRFENYGDSTFSEITWFDNGQVKSMMEQPQEHLTSYLAPLYQQRWERDGTQKVKDGNGFWSGTTKNADGSLYLEEGEVVKGRKQGKWSGKNATGAVVFEETFEQGVLQKGVSYENGETNTYSQSPVSPEFKSGLNGLYRFLGTNIKFPSEASRRGISGKVRISFLVGVDGSVRAVEVERGLGFGLDEEAIRVVKKMSGQWKPGMVRGKAVAVRYKMPINFTFE